VPGEFRKRDLQPALELLVKAGVVHKIIHSSGAGIPLGAQAKPDTFKLIFLDIALAQSILGLEATSWLLEPEVDLDERKRLRYGVRLSALNYAAADRLFSVPLYAIAQVMKFTKEEAGALF